MTRASTSSAAGADAVTTEAMTTEAMTTDAVWREFGAQLRAFVHRRIADPDRADDVLGEILLRVHKNLGRVEDREHLIRWVYRIARSAIIDDYRRAARDRDRLAPLTGDAPDQAGQEWDDDAATTLRELATCLRPLLEGLSPEQRRAVELTDLEGLTQADAAALEGVSLSGMKSRVQRGRRKLAELLGRCCALTLDAHGMPMDYTAPTDCRCAGSPR
ncbi:sigma-70 family RNA polymerase sigma factor [Rhodococcus aetherivorans]